MNHPEQNWKNLIDECTPIDTAWHGVWTAYDVDGATITTRQLVRSWHSNVDNTIVTHANRYVNENMPEISWELVKQTCNQPDGIVHPAIPSMRVLSFGKSATAWIPLHVIPETKFAIELFFRERHWRTSVAIVYEEDGTLSRFVQIHEHLGNFSPEFPMFQHRGSANDKMPAVDRDWSSQSYSMMPDLQISCPEYPQTSHILFRHNALSVSGSRQRTISLPQAMVVTIPETLQIGQPSRSTQPTSGDRNYTASEDNYTHDSFQLVASQSTTDGGWKSLAVRYDATGAFALFSAEVLQTVGAVVG